MVTCSTTACRCCRCNALYCINLRNNKYGWITELIGRITRVIRFIVERSTSRVITRYIGLVLQCTICVEHRTDSIRVYFRYQSDCDRFTCIDLSTDTIKQLIISSTTVIATIQSRCERTGAGHYTRSTYNIDKRTTKRGG